jgi:hypothetical protein
MLHRIADLCKKIDGIKHQSDKLYNLKYNNPKTLERDLEIDNLISDIQTQCMLVANDKGKYERVNEEYDDNGLPKNFTDKFLNEGI